ncbi:MAG: 16S rRNA (uracil(1498)-N(3))-methyltransferase [Lachnospiraceae bacterium]|jgi:16S rRNA (uracil1498-N3)-methyltransferase|nr:16S rRNA (uracil(1498)-N(3))-methyltransferase [Lachnospiraceae bacterium]
MRRFFVQAEQVDGSVIHITGSDVNHIRNVLRMAQGDALVVGGPDGREYTCYIKQMDEREVTAHIMYVQDTQAELPNKIYLFQGLPKSDKMEWIIQKAVELGVYEVIPIETMRAVVRLDAKKAAKKVQRWQQIAEGAAKQSGRGFVPQIHPVCSFAQALEYGQRCAVKWIPYERAEGMEAARKRVQDLQSGQDIAVFIGPEGGFDEREIQMAQERDYVPITLGRRILRTETAGLALLSVLMFRLDEDR